MKIKKQRILSLFLSVICIISVIIIPINAQAKINIPLDTQTYSFHNIGQSYIVLAKIPSIPLKQITANSNNSSVAIVQTISKNDKGYYFKITSKGIGVTKINISANGSTSSVLVTVLDTKVVPHYKINEPFIYKDMNGKDLYSVIITDVQLINEPVPFCNVQPIQLFWIKYKYTNIDSKTPIHIWNQNFNIVDSNNKLGSFYSPSQEMRDMGVWNTNPIDAIIGISCDSDGLYGVDNFSEQIQLQFKNNIDGQVDAIFDLDVPQ